MQIYGQSQEFWIEFSKANPNIKIKYVKAGESFCIESGSCHVVKKKKRIEVIFDDTYKQITEEQ